MDKRICYVEETLNFNMCKEKQKWLRRSKS